MDTKWNERQELAHAAHERQAAQRWRDEARELLEAAVRPAQAAEVLAYAAKEAGGLRGADGRARAVEVERLERKRLDCERRVLESAIRAAVGQGNVEALRAEVAARRRGGPAA